MKNNNNVLILVLLAFLIGAASMPTPPPSYYDGTFTFTSDADTGFIPINAFYWTIYNTGAATGTVRGENLPAGSTVSSPNFPIFPEDTINFDATGTTFQIYYIQKQ